MFCSDFEARWFYVEIRNWFTRTTSSYHVVGSYVVGLHDFMSCWSTTVLDSIMGRSHDSQNSPTKGHIHVHCRFHLEPLLQMKVFLWAGILQSPDIRSCVTQHLSGARKLRNIHSANLKTGITVEVRDDFLHKHYRIAK